MSERRSLLLGLLLAGVFLLAAWFTLDDYGITWDEPENFLSGELYLRFWRSGDRAWLDFPALKEQWAAAGVSPYFYVYTFARQERYPPVANLVSAYTGWLFFERLGWADPIVAHHAAIPLFGALGVLLTTLFAGQRRVAALTAGVSLALFPLYWHHAHNNVKDAPAAALFLATLWAAWRAFAGRRCVDWRWAAAAGIVWGLALGVKPNALAIPLILLAWLGWMWVWPRWRSWRAGRAPLPTAAGLALLVVLGVGILVAVWPYLWPDPPRRLWTALRYFVNVGQGYRVYFEGQTYLAGQTLPWRYALTHLVFTTPLATLLLAGVGVVRAARAAWRGEEPAAVLWLIALGATLVRVSLPGMVIYNGLRQIMEFAPLLCLLAGLGAEAVWRALAGAAETGRLGLWPRWRRPWFGRPVGRGALGAALLLLLAAPQALQLARLHPYEGAFFNLLAGGTARAGERYTLEYWGQSYKDGAAWLNAHAGPDAWVVVPIAGHLARFSLRPGLRLVVVERIFELHDLAGEGYVMFMRNRDWYDGITSLPVFCEAHGTPAYDLRVGGASILRIYRWPLTSK